jgi:multiple sugar transport system substrate-binding protein
VTGRRRTPIDNPSVGQRTPRKHRGEREEHDVKKVRRVATAVVALSLIAAACGSDDDSGTASEGTTAPDGDTPADGTAADGGSSEGGAEIRWRTRPDNDAEAQLYAGISDEIDAGNESFTLRYEPGTNEGSPYQDQLVTEIANGTAPDVFWIPGTDIARFQKEGLILDLGPLAEADGFDTSEFYPEPMYHLTFDPDAGAPGDKLWGLPRDVSTFALYINNDLIAEAGADDPRALAEAGEWDWDAFQDVAQQVTDLGGANKGFAMNGWWANYGAFMNGAGGGFFNEDRTECALDTPESVAGIQKVVDIYSADLAVPFGEDGEAPWKAGTVGMFTNGRWATPGARADVDFNWDVVELPTGPGGTQGNWLFWGAYVVNANTEHPEEAWKLVQELTSAETQSAISELGANIPSRQSDEAIEAFLGFTPPENNQAFINALQDSPTAEGPLWAGDWPAFDTAMNDAVTAVINGTRTVDDYAAKICSETAAAFDS